MIYRVELWKDGAIIGDAGEAVSRDEAKRLAERHLTERDADLVRLIDVDGSGTEAASIRRDTMEWDDE